MNKLINILEALFMLYGAIWGSLYYAGRLGYSGDKEERREERVRKFGWLLIIGVALLSIGGLGLLVSTLN